ncbi:MAG: cupin domain-containing protein [Planctomycetota bacterium]|jgi:quercetin dioxygenase-like cupin family protein
MKSAGKGTWIAPVIACLFIAGCVAHGPAVPAYDPECVLISDVTADIPEGSTKVVRKLVADCGDVTVDVVSATSDLPKHFHRDSNEIAVFITGSGEFTFEGRSPITLKPGTVLFIPKNQVHSYKNAGGRYTVVRIFAPHFAVNDRIEITDEKETDEEKP